MQNGVVNRHDRYKFEFQKSKMTDGRQFENCYITIYLQIMFGMGQLGAADSAPPIRRGQLGAANSATGQFGAGPTRRGRFGAGTFRRSVCNGDINSVEVYRRTEKSSEGS